MKARPNFAYWIASTHCGHGHGIAKGVDVRRMMAELYGKATRRNCGKGGSMHKKTGVTSYQWLYLGRPDHQASPGLFTWWEGKGA